MDKEKNLDDIIKERKMLSAETKNFIKNNIFFNFVLLGFMLIGTLLVNFAFKYFDEENFKNYIHVYQMISAIITILFFETSYRKDSLLLSLYGIESLLFSVAIMFTPYYMSFKGKVDILTLVFYIFLIYYIAKSLITFIKMRSDYIQNNISDVKEIVKDDKKSYIDEKSTKTLKEKRIKEEKQEKARLEKLNKAKKNTKNTKSTKIEKTKKTKAKTKTTKKNTKTYSKEKLDENIKKLAKTKKEK